MFCADTAKRMKNIVHIHSTRISFHKDAKRAHKVACFVLDILKKKDKTADIFLLRQNMIHAINKQWHKKDEPTNVLSFAERDVPFIVPKQLRDKNYLGEIYISPDFVRKHKQSLDHMVVHSMLHLLGYDHIKNEDAKKMEKREQTILKKIASLKL
jgi:probable rRNA maturation factor